MPTRHPGSDLDPAHERLAGTVELAELFYATTDAHMPQNNNASHRRQFSTRLVEPRSEKLQGASRSRVTAGDQPIVTRLSLNQPAAPTHKLVIAGSDWRVRAS